MGTKVLQMRTSALLEQKNSEFKKWYGVSAQTGREVSQWGHYAYKGEGQFFAIFFYGQILMNIGWSISFRNDVINFWITLSKACRKLTIWTNGMEANLAHLIITSATFITTGIQAPSCCFASCFRQLIDIFRFVCCFEYKAMMRALCSDDVTCNLFHLQKLTRDASIMHFFCIWASNKQHLFLFKTRFYFRIKN